MTGFPGCKGRILGTVEFSPDPSIRINTNRISEILRPVSLHNVDHATKPLDDRNHGLRSRTIHDLAGIVAVIEEFLGPGRFISYVDIITLDEGDERPAIGRRSTLVRVSGVRRCQFGEDRSFPLRGVHIRRILRPESGQRATREGVLDAPI